METLGITAQFPTHVLAANLPHKCVENFAIHKVFLRFCAFLRHKFSRQSARVELRGNALDIRYKCNKKVTQARETPTMVFADNQKGAWT